MSPLLSRVVVAAILLPLVIGLVYLGGWWLFGLALVGGLFALHELYVMARELRPLVLGGYLGFVTTLLGLQLGGIEWMLGGLLATFVFAFVVYGLGGVRQSATTSFAVTLLGVAWVGAGIGCLLLIRDIPEFGFWAVMAVLFTVFAADTGAFFVGRTFGRHRMAPAISPKKSWEGFVGGVLAAVGMAFVILYRDRDEFLTIPESLLLGLVDRARGGAGRPLRVRGEARSRGQGLRTGARRPRGDARPPRFAPVGWPGCLLHDPRLRARRSRA